MYVRVMYYKPEANGYSGREYTYFTQMPLQEGDKVIAPTAKEPEQKAMVTEVNISETEISPEWKDRIKEIKEYANE